MMVERTDLDKALEAAEKDEARAQEFYELFLNTEIFIPLAERPEGEEPTSIKPLLAGTGEDCRLMLFDSEARLNAWAGQEMDYAAMQGYELVELMDGEIPWVLNGGTEHPKEFDSEEILWLKASMEEVKEPTEAHA